MINEVVTFFGNYGHRYAEVFCLATAITSPVWIVDCFEDDGLIHSIIFDSEDQAKQVATKYAFDGVYE